MVESIIALLFVLLAFLAVFQYADNLRAKLLVDYAAFRSARARTVGYNDFKVLKVARLATLPAAGVCRTRDDRGKPLSTAAQRARLSIYLGARTSGNAQNILDFDYWNTAVLPQPACSLVGAELNVAISQRRPQVFDPFAFGTGRPVVFDTESANRPHCTLRGTAALEAHYPDYLQ